MKKDIMQTGKEVMTQITDVVETAGKEVVSQVSKMTDGQQAAEMSKEAIEEAIQSAVGKALDVLQVASEQVREKGVNTERVTLKAGVGIPNVAQLEIGTDVPSKAENSRGEGFSVRLDDAV